MAGFLKSRAMRHNDRAGNAYYMLAYRAGKQLTDPGTEKIHKYSRSDVKAAGVLVPSEYKGDKRLDWARNLPSLAFAMEHGKLKTQAKGGARIGWEHFALLPEELTYQQSLKLTRSFAQSLSDEYGVAAVFAVHASKKGRALYRHAHVVTTASQVGPKGVGPKANTELTQKERRERGLEGKSERPRIHDIWDEKRKAVYEAVGLKERGRGNLGRKAADSTKSTLPPKVYPQEILRQMGEFSRSVRSFAASYGEAASNREKAQANNSGSRVGAPGKSSFLWKDREDLGIKFGQMHREYERLDRVLVDASTVGGFAKMAEKRRYAPQAKAELREQSRLTPRQQALENSGMRRIHETGNQKEMMKLAVRNWEGRVKSGQPVNIPQIMREARAEAGDKKIEPKNTGHGR